MLFSSSRRNSSAGTEKRHIVGRRAMKRSVAILGLLLASACSSDWSLRDEHRRKTRGLRVAQASRRLPRPSKAEIRQSGTYLPVTSLRRSRFVT